MSQKALPSLFWRPMPLRVASGAPRPSYSLGQAPGVMNNIVVEVVDQSGKPVKDALVEFFQGPIPGSARTNGEGRAFSTGSGPLEIRATYNGLTVGQTVSSESIAKGYTTFLQFPMCINDPIIRPIDFLIFGGAAAMIVGGSHFKIKPLEMTGEIALGAAIFGLIYRLQCL
jgi:hypothetical protein